MPSSTMRTARSILVIDDDPHIRNAIDRLLMSAGWVVSSASNGLEALMLLRSGYRPAAMLLDHDMPIMNGSILLKELRTTPELARIPVVCMSGRTWPEAGVPFLEKPFSPDALFDLLATVNFN